MPAIKHICYIAGMLYTMLYSSLFRLAHGVLYTMVYSLVYSLHARCYNVSLTSTAFSIVMPAGSLASSGTDRLRSKLSLQLFCVEVRNPCQ